MDGKRSTSVYYTCRFEEPDDGADDGADDGGAVPDIPCNMQSFGGSGVHNVGGVGQPAITIEQECIDACLDDEECQAVDFNAQGWEGNHCFKHFDVLDPPTENAKVNQHTKFCPQGPPAKQNLNQQLQDPNNSKAPTTPRPQQLQG